LFFFPILEIWITVILTSIGSVSICFFAGRSCFRLCPGNGCFGGVFCGNPQKPERPERPDLDYALQYRSPFVMPTFEPRYEEGSLDVKVGRFPFSLEIDTTVFFLRNALFPGFYLSALGTSVSFHYSYIAVRMTGPPSFEIRI